MFGAQLGFHTGRMRSPVHPCVRLDQSGLPSSISGFPPRNLQMPAHTKSNDSRLIGREQALPEREYLGRTPKSHLTSHHIYAHGYALIHSGRIIYTHIGCSVDGTARDVCAESYHFAYQNVTPTPYLTYLPPYLGKRSHSPSILLHFNVI